MNKYLVLMPVIFLFLTLVTQAYAQNASLTQEDNKAKRDINSALVYHLRHLLRKQ